jgi:signal peptidase I
VRHLEKKQKADSKKQRKSEGKAQINTLPLYIALIVIFVLFIYYQSVGSLSVIFGIALFMIIVVIIVIEITNGIKEEGFKRNLLEIGAAILIVIVLWFSLKAILHTSYPLDVVPSCSMLPNLQRGDLILLQGVSSIKQIKAPIINISSSEYTNLKSNIKNEFLSCVAYEQVGNGVAVSQIVQPGYSVGMLANTQEGEEIVQDSYQQQNLIQYSCGSVPVKFSNGTIKNEASVTSITINGTAIKGDKNNSIVVYETVPQDYFYKLGDSYIVHRAYAILNASGNYLVLTKGDNNPGLDLQYGNYPSNMSYVNGRVIFSIPYLGYLKLVLSNSFSEPAGCNSTLVN